MNYELAKQLKDAGFPLPRMGGWIREEGQEPIAAPNLSELIAACGDRLMSVNKHPWKGNWYATGMATGWFKVPQEFGDSPEEAVARLWLALNNKND